MKSYYDILQVSEQASVEEIKKAYRKKAKQYHPDINSSPTAEADFIQINTAYEYLINEKLGLSYNSEKRRYQSTGTEWNAAHQEAANKRAEYYARKRYKDFIKSQYYKESKLIDNFANFAGLMLYAAFIFIFPFAMSLFYDVPAWGMSLMFALMSIPGWGPLLMQTKFSLPNIREGAKLTFQSSYMEAVLYFIIFFIIYFTVGFRTLITVYEVIGYLLLLSFVVIRINKVAWKMENLKTLITKASVAALIFAGMLCVNYFISFGEQEEVYDFKLVFEENKYGQMKPTSTGLLENNAYSNYPSIRFFFDREDIRMDKKICYTMKRGIFMYRVYSRREFI